MPVDSKQGGGVKSRQRVRHKFASADLTAEFRSGNTTTLQFSFLFSEASTNMKTANNTTVCISPYLVVESVKRVLLQSTFSRRLGWLVDGASWGCWVFNCFAKFTA